MSIAEYFFHCRLRWISTVFQWGGRVTRTVAHLVYIKTQSVTVALILAGARYRRDSREARRLLSDFK